MINLFHLSSNVYGGWVTFTYHLTKSLEMIGEEVRLFKVGNRFEETERNFGYGLTYQNVDINTARGLVAKSGGIITATDKRHAANAHHLRACGALTVVHDPTEFKNMPGVETWDRVITIRPTVQRLLPKSIFIPHPYVPQGKDLTSYSRSGAVSISRIDFDKRTDLILDANRILRSRGQEPIDIRGFENRIYTNFHILPRYPEWQQSINHYPREADVAYCLCSIHTFMVDMSEIKGDGGGTQYTTLEAIDAGAIPILNTAWGEGEMINMENCIMVPHAGALADVVGEGIEDDFAEELRYGGTKIMLNHHPIEIAKVYEELYARD